MSRLRLLLERRVRDELAVDARDADADERAAQGMSEMWSAALRAGQREDVGRVLLVAREDGRDDLRVVLEALGEERAAAGGR